MIRKRLCMLQTLISVQILQKEIQPSPLKRTLVKYKHTSCTNFNILHPTIGEDIAKAVLHVKIKMVPITGHKGEKFKLLVSKDTSLCRRNLCPIKKGLYTIKFKGTFPSTVPEVCVHACMFNL